MTDLTLEQLPSRNGDWQARRMPHAIARVLSGQTGDRLTAAFGLAYGLRSKPYRLRDSAGNVVAVNRPHRWRCPVTGMRGALSTADAYGVRTWVEHCSSPGTFSPRIDVAASVALIDAGNDTEALALARTRAAARGSDGLPVSRQLVRLRLAKRECEVIADL